MYKEEKRLILVNSECVGRCCEQYINYENISLDKDIYISAGKQTSPTKLLLSSFLYFQVVNNG